MSSAVRSVPAFLKRWWLRCVLAIVFLAIAGSMLVGRGGLGYFNPYALEYRAQREWTIGFGSIPIYRTSLQTHQLELIAHVRDSGLVQPIAGPDRWDLVFHWNDAWKDGFGIAYRALARNSDATIEWSNKNPELAQI